MRICCVIVAGIALCSCESRNPAASSSEAGSAASQSEPSPKRTRETVIVLDETQQEKGHVVVESVRAREIGATVTIPGRLTFSEDLTWRVGAIASGRIDNISARVGDSVDAGQVLGRIHSHEVHEARAGLPGGDGGVAAGEIRGSIRQTKARSCAEAL